MINRSAVIVRPKAPFIAWLNGIENDGIGKEALEDRTVYLIPNFDDQRGFNRILKDIWPEIFERELHAWYVVESVWP